MVRMMMAMRSLYPGFTLRNDDNLHIFGETNDLSKQSPPPEQRTGLFPAACQEDLGYLICVGKVYQRFGRVVSLEHPGFDSQVAGKIEMPFDCPAFPFCHPIEIARRMHRYGKALGFQEVAIRLARRISIAVFGSAVTNSRIL